MAITALADLVYGDEYTSYSFEQAIELNAFVQTGIAAENPKLNELAAGQGGVYILPFWKPLANDEPNISTDVEADVAVAKKIQTGREKCRLHMYNQSWGAADLNVAMLAEDPMTAIIQQTAKYWATWSQKMMISTAIGVMKDNIANDGGDMVVNISTVNNAAVSAGASRDLSDNTLIDAAQTMGDHKSDLIAIAMHSAVHSKLRKRGALQEHHDMETGALLFETFQGKRVYVDDAMPVEVVSIDDGTGAANRNVYTSVVFGAGAFQIGQGAPKVAQATVRDELAGNGGGVEKIVERRHPIVHASGFEWLEAAVVAESATRAELETAANWSRVFQRKNVKLAFIKSRLD